MMTPLPTQISGAAFLAARRTALLADAPRVGKSGAAIMAADQIGAKRILVITTASGRAVWRKAWTDWSAWDRRVHVLGDGQQDEFADVWIVSWNAIWRSATFVKLKNRIFDLYILDEDHRAKNPDTKTARAVYGRFDRGGNHVAFGIVSTHATVWHLTGTPMPHDPGDMWCRLRASAPDILLGDRSGTLDVMAYDDFRNRYCVIAQKRLSPWTRIPVVVGGKNLDELKARIGDWMLRRTQADVGIRPPVTELMPVSVPAAARREIERDPKLPEIIAAIDAGQTDSLEMHLGPLLRLTGKLKAEACVEAVDDVLDGNDDKLVLAYWHREVGDELRRQLREFEPVLVDGSTTPIEREWFINAFHNDPKCRVFLAQIKACGEAVDLSAAAELWFVESIFSPAGMAQMASRISNVGQTKPTFVKVLTIEKSIDEAIQASLLRLWTAINQVLK